MKSNILVPAVLATALVGGLALTGCSTDASDDFKSRCKQANGEVKRENDVDLGMAPQAFVAGKGGGKSGGSSKGSSKGGGLGGLFGGNSKPKPKPKNEAPKTDKKNDGWKLADKGNSKPKPKKKSSKSDDNDFLCVKNGNVLFEEEE